MKNNLDQHRRVAELGRRDEAIYEFLAMKYWTPAMAALLVSGIRAENGSVQIPAAGVGLDNQPLPGSSPRFHEARRILAEWNDWIEDGEQDGRNASTSEIDPIDFFAWCDDERIDTEWLRLFRLMAGSPTKGQIDTAPSSLSLFAQPNSSAIQGANVARPSSDRQPTTLAPVVHKLNTRRNVLSSVIERAVELAGSDVAASVFHHLREMALNEYPPFTGVIDTEKGLAYTDGEKGKLDSLSFSMLSSRLQRRRNRR